jgi:hypothetical protein
MRVRELQADLIGFGMTQVLENGECGTPRFMGGNVIASGAMAVAETVERICLVAAVAEFHEPI